MTNELQDVKETKEDNEVLQLSPTKAELAPLQLRSRPEKKR